MNIDKLGAGPEMDALIAKEVMGWTEVVSDGLYCWRDVDAYERTGECIDRIARQENTKGYKVEDIEAWSPSTDIATAWQVVEQLANKFYFDITDFLPGGWRATFVGKRVKDGQARIIFSVADTAQLAICRAALKAVMSE